MFKKTILAVAATIALGTAALTPTSASAGHGFHGGHGGHWGHGWGRGFGWGGFGLAVVGATCYQYQTFMTPVGPRTRLVNVCY